MDVSQAVRRAAGSVVATIFKNLRKTQSPCHRLFVFAEPLEQRCLLSTTPVPFQLNSSYSIGGSPSDVVAADVNGDGKMDAIAVLSGSNTISVSLGDGHGGFGSPTFFSVGSDPVWAAVGDFNGDGHVDIATANAGNNTVSVLLGNGQGSFAPASISGVSIRDYSLGANPQSVSVGDFNGDGKLDIATANSAGVLSSAPILSVLLGNGDGTFQAPLQSQVHAEHWAFADSLAVGDFNGDGKPDLAIGNPDDPTIFIALGNGDGTFSYSTSITASGSEMATDPVGFAGSVFSADLNGDGKADLAVASTDSGIVTVEVWLGNGNGTFGSESLYYAGDGPGSLSISDLNGDGKPDLIVTNSDYDPSYGTYGTGGVSIFLNNGDGTFQPSTAFGTGSRPVAAAIADFSGDGTKDLLVANAASNDLSLDLGFGDGTFSAPKDILVASAPTQENQQNQFGFPQQISASGDVNGDGIPDIVTAEWTTDQYYSPGGLGYISVLLGKGDGTFQDAIEIPAGYGVRTLAVGDFDGDGKADVAVLTYVTPGVTVFSDWSNGTFSHQATYAVAEVDNSIVAADFNGDGKLDLAVSAWTDTNVQVLLNNGDGTFAAPLTFTDPGMYSTLVVGDLNGDGKPDLVVTSGPSDDFGVLLNEGNVNGQWQGLSSPITASNSNVGPYIAAAAVGDFNGDGKMDIATTTGFSPDDNHELDIWLGNGDGTFQSPTRYTGFSGESNTLVAADMNNDGKTDLISADGDSGTFSIFLNKGSSAGSWLGVNAPEVITASSWVSSLAVGHFNRDDQNDVVTANTYGFNVTVFLQDQPPTASAGGPYSITEGSSITLGATATGADGSLGLSYEWDLDYDGTTFNPMVVGTTPTFNPITLGLNAGSDTVAVRVTDLAGASAIATATVAITEPQVTISGSSSVAVESSYSLNLSATNLGGATIFAWTINWGDGTSGNPDVQTYGGSTSSASHNYATSGNYTISATMTDSVGTYTANGTLPLAVQRITPTLTGSSGPDTFYLIMNNGVLDVYQNEPPTSAPSFTWGLYNLSGLSIMGGGGNDTLTVDFSGGAFVSSNHLSGGVSTISFNGGLIGSSAVNVVFTGLGATGNLQVGSTSALCAPSSLLPTTVNYANAHVTVQAGLGTLIVDGGSVSVNTTSAAGTNPSDPGLSVQVQHTGSQAILQTGQRLQSLAIGSGSSATVIANGSQALVVDSLSISQGGKLDLANNDMIIRGGSLSVTTSLLATGYSGGRWNGLGITSSTAQADPLRIEALGVAQVGTGFTLPGNTFDGQVVSNGDILVKFTYYGDANLDGEIDNSDQNLLNAGITSQTTSNPLSGWENGDFNYDGHIDGNDSTLLASTDSVGGPLSISGGLRSQIYADAPVTGLRTTTPGNGSIVEWQVDWGNGQGPQTFSASVLQAPYTSPGVYNAVFTALDDSGNAIYTYPHVTINVTQTPAPTSLTATVASSNEIDLAWTNSIPASDGATVYESTDGTNFTAIFQLDPGNLTYQVFGLSASTTYAFAVTSDATDGETPPSNQTSGTTPPAGPPLPVPTGLVADAPSETQVNLEWNASADPDITYSVYRGTTPNFTPDGDNQIAFGVIGGFYADVLDSAPTNGTIYYYQLFASSDISVSPAATISVAFPVTPVMPIAPQSFIATPVAGDRIDLSWSDSAIDESDFTIVRATDAAFTQNVTDVATVLAGTTQYSDTGLSADTQYYYEITADSDGGTSSAASSGTSTDDSTVFEPPSDLEVVYDNVADSPSNAATEPITLAWTDNSGGQSSFTMSEFISSLSTTPYSFSLTPGTVSYTTGIYLGYTYTFAIQPANSTVPWNSDSFNNVVVVNTPPESPVPVAVAAPGTTDQINLHWPSVVGAQGYNVFRVENGKDISLGGTTSTSFSDTGLTEGTTYNYQVSAYNDAGSGPPSVVYTAATNPLSPTNLQLNIVDDQLEATWDSPSQTADTFQLGDAFQANTQPQPSQAMVDVRNISGDEWKGEVNLINAYYNSEVAWFNITAIVIPDSDNPYFTSNGASPSLTVGPITLPTPSAANVPFNGENESELSFDNFPAVSGPIFRGNTGTLSFTEGEYIDSDVDVTVADDSQAKLGVDFDMPSVIQALPSPSNSNVYIGTATITALTTDDNQPLTAHILLSDSDSISPCSVYFTIEPAVSIHAASFNGLGTQSSPALLKVDNALDAEGIPAFADGYGANAWSASHPADYYVDQFIPIYVDIPAASYTSGSISFSYSASDPAQLQTTPPVTPGGSTSYVPALGTDGSTGELRLWTKPWSSARNPASVASGGDYIPPNTPIPLSPGNSNGTLVFYVEAVGVNLANYSKQLSIGVTFSGQGIAGGGPIVIANSTDHVVVTCVYDKGGWQAFADQTSGFNPLTWNPTQGWTLNTNNQNDLYDIYDFYAYVYTLDPTKFQWLGLAHVAGGSVIFGLNKMTTAYILSVLGMQGLNIPATLQVQILAAQAQMQTTFLNMAASIYHDLSWQFLAYHYGGINEISRLVGTGDISPVPTPFMKTTLLTAWQNIDSGIQGKIWAGNLMLVDDEQNVILSPYYGVLRGIWIVPGRIRADLEMTKQSGARSPLAPFHGTTFPFNQETFGPTFKYWLDNMSGLKGVGTISANATRWAWLGVVWADWQQIPSSIRNILIGTPVVDLADN